MGMIINPSRFGGGGGGGGFSPASYRYWRILITDNNGSSTEVAIGRVEMFARDDDGYLYNVLTGGTASASSKNSASGYEATNAFDNANPIATSDPNCWASNAKPTTGSPQWLKYDLGSGNDKPVCAFAIHGRANATFAPGQSPKDFVLQGSNDDSAWTDVITVTGSTSWTALEMRRFLHADYPSYSGSLFGARRYWRWHERSLNGAGALGEFEMHATIGGANYAPAGTISASSTDSSNTISKAFDNNTSTFWSPTINVPDAYFDQDFGAGNEKVCAEMVNKARNDAFVAFSPGTILLRCRPNTSVPWATVISTGSQITSWTAGQSRTHSDSQFV